MRGLWWQAFACLLLTAETQKTHSVEHQDRLPTNATSQDEKDDSATPNETGTVTDANETNNTGSGNDDELLELIATVVRPERLQPFWLMPMYFGSKTLATIFVLGLDHLSTSSRIQWWESIKAVLRPLSSLVFIAFALNAWVYDVQRVIAAPARTLGMKVAAALIVCVTSANYVASKAIWTSLRFQAPGNLLGLRPKYITFVGVPVIPGAATWLGCLKHLYAFILWPYDWLANLVVYIASLVATCVLCCRGLFCAVLGVGCKALCCLWVSALLVVFTFGQWDWATSTVAWSWDLMWPFLYFILMLFWATSFAPILWSTLYAILIRAHRGPLLELFQWKLPRLDNLREQIALPNTLIPKEHQDALRKLHRQKLKNDFDLEDVDAEDADSLVPGNEDAEKAEAATTFVKIFVCFGTVQQMAQIMVEQMICIMSLRMAARHSAFAIVEAFRETLWERHLVSYLGSLTDHMAILKSQAEVTAWGAVDFLYSVWGSF